MPRAATPAEPAAELLTIKAKHGPVRREGRWTLPHRLALRTAWCGVLLDLTSAVRSGPELIIDDTPETLHIRLVGKMKHGRISAR